MRRDGHFHPCIVCSRRISYSLRRYAADCAQAGLGVRGDPGNPCPAQPANDAEPNSLPQSQEPKSDSEPDLAGRLILAMSHLTIALAELTEGLTKQAEAISQLAMSNEALADAVTSQPDDGEESEPGYLS